MRHEKWDEYLVAEHEMIERAMDVMKTELGALTKGKSVPLKLQRSVDFLLQFGDKIHNTKEERFLFPLMEERGIPVQGGPIAVMLAEHEAERELLGNMQLSLPDFENMDDGEVKRFISDGLQYLDVRANHIWKENDVLYAMGRKVLSDEDNNKLVESFRAIDMDTYGEDADELFEKMLSEAEQGRAATTSLIKNLSYEQLDAIMETLPMEVTFVDANDSVAYFNRLDKEKIFVRTRSVIGRKVQMCHPANSVDKVSHIVNGFKDGTLDKADFWIDFKGDKVLIRYFPVRNPDGEYMGVLEVTQNIGWIQSIKGEKRL